jgi:pSer/pThr/pTyr-binding forkhead associated (FHA) protein
VEITQRTADIMLMSKVPVLSLNVETPDKPAAELLMSEGEELSIGRGVGQGLLIADTGVSRAHAILRVVDGLALLLDLGSTNGTFVNGNRIDAQIALNEGDVVNIGAGRVRVHFLGSSAEVEDTRAMTAQLKSVPVTVLVAGVINFDQVVRELQESLVRQRMSDWSRELVPLIQKQGGVLQSPERNNLVAFWSGADAEQNAIAAARAAVQIHQLNVTAPPMFRTSSVLISCRGLSDGLNGGTTVAIVGEPVQLGCSLQRESARMGTDIIVTSDAAELLKALFSIEALVVPAGSAIAEEGAVYTLH